MTRDRPRQGVKPMTGDILRGWLLRIANSLEHWPATTNNRIDDALIVERPIDALVRIVATEISDERDRAVVTAALPRLATENYAEAARQIRAVVPSLCVR
jgi:hypothetical protein